MAENEQFDFSRVRSTGSVGYRTRRRERRPKVRFRSCIARVELGPKKRARLPAIDQL
jgi:hypothetical protein